MKIYDFPKNHTRRPVEVLMSMSTTGILLPNDWDVYALLNGMRMLVKRSSLWLWLFELKQEEYNEKEFVW